MALRRAEAVRIGSHDPVADVAQAVGIDRPGVKRMLDAYDLVAPHLATGEIRASLGTVEAWRRLSAIDPRQATSMRDQVLSGALPLSAVNQAVVSARAARAISPEVAAMGSADVLRIVRDQTGFQLWEEPRGFAELIPVDAEYRRAVDACGPGETLPRRSPAWALLVSPWLAWSRSRGAQPAAFMKSVVTSVGMYPIVVVACSSDVERDALEADLAECEISPSRLHVLLLK